MTRNGNNDMEMGVAEDIDPHENTKVMRDNNDEMEVFRMVHKCFETFDDLSGCGSPILQFNTEIRKYGSVFPYFALAYKKNLVY